MLRDSLPKVPPLLAVLIAVWTVAVLAACSPNPTTAPAEPAATPPAVIVGLEAQPEPTDAALSSAPTLTEIRALVPYTVRLPGWVPDGYALQPEVGIAADDDSLLVEWRHAAGGAIDLVVGPSPPSLPDAPARFTRLTEVNGEPALLIFGMHDASDDGWEPRFHLMITWQVDGVHYTLAATGRHTSKQVLLIMAESFS